jgi:hypothetical protein
MEPPLTRSPSKAGHQRKYLALLYPEYFCAAHRTDALGSRSAILEHDTSWVAHLPLLPALHAISCCHDTLLLFLLWLYCYYKSKALSIPFGLSQQRIQDFSKRDSKGRTFDLSLLRTSVVLVETRWQQLQCHCEAFQTLLFSQYCHSLK